MLLHPLRGDYLRGHHVQLRTTHANPDSSRAPCSQEGVCLEGGWVSRAFSKPGRSAALRLRPTSRPQQGPQSRRRTCCAPRGVSHLHVAKFPRFTGRSGRPTLVSANFRRMSQSSVSVVADLDVQVICNRYWSYAYAGTRRSLDRSIAVTATTQQAGVVTDVYPRVRC